MTESTNTLGRYQILREIARSNDVVYEAVDPIVGRRVALKELVFPPNLTGSQHRERIQRFYREAKAAGALAHPNIVTIYEVGEQNGRHFIAMEFLEGQTLRDILRVRGALPVQEAVRIAVDLCGALGYAHSKGVIHRDVKPDNIYVLPDGRVKLADFGIARLTTEPTLTAVGQVFGTPSYMSPEQVEGKPVDGRSDIFSLGVVLHEMLAGVKPFTGESVVTITYNIINGYPELPANIPTHVGATLRRAMAKKADDRFTMTSEMAEALTNPAFAAAQPAGARGTKPPVPPAPPSAGTFPQPMPQPTPARLQRTPALSARQRARLWSAILGTIILSFLTLTTWAVSASFRSYRAQQLYGNGINQANRAAELFQAQRFSQSLAEMRAALEKIDQAWKASPDSRIGLRARTSAATVAVSVGRLQLRVYPYQPAQALDSFRRALFYDHENAEAYLEIGNYYGRMAFASFSRQNIEYALNNWEQTASLAPGTEAARNAVDSYANLCFQAGSMFWQNGDRDAAREYWSKAVANAGSTEAARKAEDYLNMSNEQ